MAALEARAFLALATLENMLRMCAHLSSDTDVGRRGGGDLPQEGSLPALAVLPCPPLPSCWLLEAGVGVSREASTARPQGRARGGDPYHRRCEVDATWGPRGKGYGQLGRRTTQVASLTLRLLRGAFPVPATAFSCLGALGPVLATPQHLLMAWLTHSTHPARPLTCLTLVPTRCHACSLFPVERIFSPFVLCGSRTGSRCCNSKPCRSVERGRRPVSPRQPSDGRGEVLLIL